MQQTIQWFPGHMAKTRRLIRENLKLVDLVVELRDARIPYSSANPEIDSLIQNKPRVLLLNKSDLADAAITQSWCDHFRAEGINALAVDCRSGKGLRRFTSEVMEVLSEQIERRRAKGITGIVVRMMVVGVPNVGKSSLINRFGGKRTKVEDRPGVTRGKQWVRIDSGMEFLDMPGVLWPKFEDQTVGENLAITGAVKDDIIDLESLSCRLLQRMRENYSHLLMERYRFAAEELGENTEGYELLEIIARKRGMMMSGGQVNTERAAIAVLDEFRAGTIGRISLETPQLGVEL